MKTFEVDENNDIVVKNGNLSVVEELEALKNRIQNALQTFKGEIEDTEQGVDYLGIILENINPVYKIQEFKRVIRNIYGVLDVTNATYRQDTQNGTAIFAFEISSIYGKFVIEQGVE